MQNQRKVSLDVEVSFLCVLLPLKTYLQCFFSGSFPYFYSFNFYCIPNLLMFVRNLSSASTFFFTLTYQAVLKGIGILFCIKDFHVNCLSLFHILRIYFCYYIFTIIYPTNRSGIGLSFKVIYFYRVISNESRFK